MKRIGEGKFCVVEHCVEIECFFRAMLENQRSGRDDTNDQQTKVDIGVPGNAKECESLVHPLLLLSSQAQYQTICKHHRRPGLLIRILSFLKKLLLKLESLFVG